MYIPEASYRSNSCFPSSVISWESGQEKLSLFSNQTLTVEEREDTEGIYYFFLFSSSQRQDTCHTYLVSPKSLFFFSSIFFAHEEGMTILWLANALILIPLLLKVALS